MTMQRMFSGRGARPQRPGALAFLAVVALGAAACSESLTTVQEPVATVQVASPVATLTVGDSVSLQASLRSATGQLLTGRTVTWISSDTLVATVRANGRVLARKSGSVTITAASEGRSGTVTLQVHAAPQTGPQVSTLHPAQAYQGAEGVSIILVGSGFDHTSTVYWNGQPRPTHRSGTLEIQALIPDTDLQVAGTVVIEVVNQNGTRSAPQTFTIMPRPAPAPIRIVIDPNPVVVMAGGSRQVVARYVDAAGKPVAGSAPVTFWVDDTNVATVGADGVVSGVKAGTTRIQAAGGGLYAAATVEVRFAPQGPRLSYQSAVAPPTGEVVDTILWSAGGSAPAVRAQLVVRVARIHVDMEAGSYVQEFQAYVRYQGQTVDSTGWMEHGKAFWNWLGGGFVFEPAGGAASFVGYPGGYGDLVVVQKVRNGPSQTLTYQGIPTPQP